MGKFISILIISLLLMFNKCVDKQSDDDMPKITYLGYKSDMYNTDFNTLKFKIENNTVDTIYISRENIVVTVKKGKAIIKGEKPPSIGTPFVKPIVTNKLISEAQKQNEEEKNSLKIRFAYKLYEKNFSLDTVHKKSKDFVIENIIRDCIVLMPNESIDYETLFISKKFNKTYKIDVKYSDNEIFTYFLDDKEKRVDIKK